MTPLTFSRHDRLRMRRLSAQNTSTVEADRRFFSRLAHRTYRIRRASRAEIEQLQVADGGKPLQLAADRALFALIKQVAPGVRLRILVPGPSNEDGNDTSDDLGAHLWGEFIAKHPDVAEQEAAFHDALHALRDPLYNGSGR